jgi:lysyl-tRNA synthetase class 2
VATAAELAPGDVAQLAQLENHWRRQQRRLQGFAMTLGRLGGAPEDHAMLHVFARAGDGRIGAVLRFAVYGGGYSLDAMRRSDDAPNGLTEALVCVALEHARDMGATEVSLNFAGFGHLMAPCGPLSRRERVAQAALRVAHSRFQLERLSSFNDKFDPVWRPRYLLYEGRSSLVRSGLRVLQAEAYVRAPHTPPLEPRWRPPEWPLPEWSPAPR